MSGVYTIGYKEKPLSKFIGHLRTTSPTVSELRRHYAGMPTSNRRCYLASVGNRRQ